MGVRPRVFQGVVRALGVLGVCPEISGVCPRAFFKGVVGVLGVFPRILSVVLGVLGVLGVGPNYYYAKLRKERLRRSHEFGREGVRDEWDRGVSFWESWT